MNEYNAYYRFDDSQKYIKQKLEDGQDIFNYIANMEESKKIINGLTKALKDSLDDKYMESESAKVDVDGKEVSTTKNTLILNKANLIALIGAYIDNMGENEELMEIFGKYADMTAEQFKASLSVIKANIGTYIGDEIPVIKVSVYTKGFNNDFVRFEVESEGQKIGITETEEGTYTFDGLGQKLGYVKVTGEDNDKEYEISVGYGEYKVNLNVKYTKEENANVSEKDIYSYINSEDVTSSYYDSLLRKLNNNSAFKKLYNYISGSTYSSSSSSYYLYD